MCQYHLPKSCLVSSQFGSSFFTGLSSVSTPLMVTEFYLAVLNFPSPTLSTQRLPKEPETQHFSSLSTKAPALTLLPSVLPTLWEVTMKLLLWGCAGTGWWPPLVKGLEGLITVFNSSLFETYIPCTTRKQMPTFVLGTTGIYSLWNALLSFSTTLEAKFFSQAHMVINFFFPLQMYCQPPSWVLTEWHCFCGFGFFF